MRRHGLADEHAHAADGLQPALCREAQEFRLAGVVHGVERRAAAREHVLPDDALPRIRVHADARRIQREVVAAVAVFERRIAQDAERPPLAEPRAEAAKLGRQRLGLFDRRVAAGEIDRGRRGGEHGLKRDGARRAAAPENQEAARKVQPAAPQRLFAADAVGRVALHAAVFVLHRVHGAEQRRLFVDRVEKRQDRALVRDRNVEARKRAQRRKLRLDRRHVQNGVGRRKAGKRKKAPVDKRRHRVADRMPDHGKAGEVHSGVFLSGAEKICKCILTNNPRINTM